jgi:hypothetical protein
MLQRLLRSDAVSRIIHKDSLKQVDKILEEGVISRNDVLLYVSLDHRVLGRKAAYIKVLHGLNETTGAASCVWRRIIELEAFEISVECKYVKVGNRRNTYLEAALPPLRVDILLTAWTR